jgi:hypothetical protein
MAVGVSQYGERRHLKKKRQLEQEGLMPKRGRVEMEEEVEKLWPSPVMCLSCFDEDESYNEDEVYDLLEETYW